MAVQYPIAPDSDAALKAPAGRAARERDARQTAGQDVAFVRELTGPLFETRQAAEQAYSGWIDADGGSTIGPEDRYCELMEVAEPAAGRIRRGGQAEPVFEAGHRWPAPNRRIKTGWRLSVAYWRLVDAAAAPASLPQARAARRGQAREALDAAALRALASQPLQAVKPQQALDIGLFEVRLPESPDIIVPDE